MKYLCPFLSIYFEINVGDSENEQTDDDSDDSSKTESYVPSNQHDSDEFEESDNEPLSKKALKRSTSPEFEEEASNSSKRGKRGRPHGKTKPKTPQSVSSVKVSH